MKVHFVKPASEHIEGYHRIQDLSEFGQLTDSECDLIFANDILDSFSLKDTDEAIGLMKRKLRLGGHLIVGGTDLRLFCKSVINGSISAEDASKTIESLDSMQESAKMRGYLQQIGLTIVTASIDGIHYELKATRSNG